MAKKNSPYFDDFITMAFNSVRAAEYLHSVFASFDPSKLDEQRSTMHEIEHAADEVRHALMKRLVKEFVTPIDREDIIQLANELDSVTDKIDDILIRMYMYNINELRPEALAFSEVIVRCCKAMHTAMVEFPSFRRSTTLIPAIIEVNTTEEKGDEIYIDAVRKLFNEGGDPLFVAAWSELFDRLEDCCDACEDVADLVEIVALKNS